MDHIGSLLTKVLKKRGLYKHAEASLIVQQSQEWLKKKLPKFIRDLRVVSFKDGTLTVSCANSIAAQECQQVSHELMQYLASECGAQGLEGVRCTRD